MLCVLEELRGRVKKAGKVSAVRGRIEERPQLGKEVQVSVGLGGHLHLGN